MDDDKKEILKTLEEDEKYLETWWKRSEKIQREAPRVQQQLENLRWQKEAVKGAPLPPGDPFPRQLINFTADDLSATRRSLPELPIINSAAIVNSVAGTVSTASMIYDRAFQAYRAEAFELRTWGNYFGTAYEEQQERQGREKQVHDLLDVLKPELAVNFDGAVNEYRILLGSRGRVSGESAGTKIRNIHSHYKGELMEVAQRRLRKQRVDWSEMAQCFIVDSVARTRFESQEDRWRNIQDRLTSLAKSQKQYNESELKQLFTDWLDHLFIVLSLVESAVKERR